MTYRLSPRARSDLRDILRYSVEHWGEIRARSYVQAITERLTAVDAGRVPARSAHLIRPGYLKTTVGRHAIYFRRLPNGDLVVVRILHQSMDVATQLRGDA